MSIQFYIQALIGKLIGYGFAFFILFKLLFSFIRHPITFVKETFLTKRSVMPKCLNDPSLGNHEFARLEDVKLHYVVNGDENKPLMIFIHGFPEFWYSWRYQLREFSKDYRVVAIDQRGYGDSDKPSGVHNYSIGKLAADIKQLIPALGYKKSIVVAHDWGGAVAWNFVTNYPDLVEKFIVCNCPHPGVFQKYIKQNRSQFKKSWYMMFFQTPFIPELSIYAHDLKFFEMLFKGIKNNPLSNDDIEAYKYTFGTSGALTPPINYYRAAFSNPKIVKEYPKITPPGLIIWGDPDLALDTEMAQLSAEQGTDIQVKVIKNSTHFVQLDRPKEMNAAIRDFLK